MLKSISTLLVFSAVLLAQKPDAGVSPEWDIRKDMTALAAQIRQMQPMINNVKPETWIAQGAPSTWVQQMAKLQAGIQYLLESTEKLAKTPERLTTALDTYFRLQDVETRLDSIREGLKKYQSPDLAEILNGLMIATFDNREKLRGHISDLASLREQEMSVMDQEAQRCRGVLSRIPPVIPASEKRRSSKSEIK
ncbi:MAG: hypothetical protein ABJF23_13780 [Bryobacteraceae bacterium]